MNPCIPDEEQIAIVGIGCRYPGGINSPSDMWSLLNSGTDAVSELPPNRWSAKKYYAPYPARPGRVYTWAAGVIGGVELFDPKFFGFTPQEARSTDPQQRLLLEVCWEALEHARLAVDQLRDTRTGVFVGIGASEYMRRALWGNPEIINVWSGIGNTSSVAAGRISHTLGLRGPAIAIDTSCSSSMVAIHLACQSLLTGECDAALAGGVNLLLDPASTIALCQLGALSPQGRCKAFSSSADGYVRSEGCGILVLKRLSAARRNADCVLAVIRATAINHDGGGMSLTAPNGLAQEAVINEALMRSRLRPSEVQYVEAHGTGTLLGDPVEIKALANTYGRERSADDPLLVGSVKSNIGHTEAAAGVAGVIKAVLSLTHQEIPATLFAEEGNPLIPWDDIAVRTVTVACKWKCAGPRRAGISSFGMSGTNVHIIVESAPEDLCSGGHIVLTEHDTTRCARSANERPLHVLCISGHNENALRAQTRRLSETISAQCQEISLEDICFSANTTRAHQAYRFAIMAANTEQLLDRLNSLDTAEPRDVPGALSTRVQSGRPPKMAFCFLNDGVSTNVTQDFYEGQEAFRSVLLECEQWLRAEVAPDMSFEGSRFVSRSAPGQNYEAFGAFAAQLGIHKTLGSWGMRPDILAGVGTGEIVAACASGVLSIFDALSLVLTRSRKDPVGKWLDRISSLKRPAVHLFSASRGRFVTDRVATTEYWTDLIGHEVRRDCAELLRQQGAVVRVVCGNRDEVSWEVVQSDKDWLYVCESGKNSWETIMALVAELYMRGATIDWRAFDSPYKRRKLELPTYPFQRERYWIDFEDEDHCPVPNGLGIGFAESHEPNGKQTVCDDSQRLNEYAVLMELTRIARDVFIRPDLELLMDSDISRIDGWDSLKYVEIILAIEETYGIELRSHESDRIKLVRDFVELISRSVERIEA